MPSIPMEYIDFGIKLLTATVLSGVIGLEREIHGRAAGLRTHILVCLAATIIITSSQSIQNLFVIQGSESVFRIDPWRIAAGILTGIGFLGGGAILKSEDLIRGLTTAACIWFVAAIGIVVGVGMYIPATMGTAIALLVLVGLDPIGHRIPSVSYSKITITSSMEFAEKIDAMCFDLLKKQPIKIQNTLISADVKNGQRTIVLFIRSRKLKDKHPIVKQILGIPHVENVIWE